MKMPFRRGRKRKIKAPQDPTRALLAEIEDAERMEEDAERMEEEANSEREIADFEALRGQGHYLRCGKA